MKTLFRFIAAFLSIAGFVCIIAGAPVVACASLLGAVVCILDNISDQLDKR